jgi:hypothetical protein
MTRGPVEPLLGRTTELSRLSALLDDALGRTTARRALFR